MTIGLTFDEFINVKLRPTNEDVPKHRSATPQQACQANVLGRYAKVVFDNTPPKFCFAIPACPNFKLPLFNFFTFGFSFTTQATNHPATFLLRQFIHPMRSGKNELQHESG